MSIESDFSGKNVLFFHRLRSLDLSNLTKSISIVKHLWIMTLKLLSRFHWMER